MTIKPLEEYTDEALVRYFQEWTVKQSKVGLNYVAYNRIDRDNLIPSRDILARRGPASLAKLLSLTDDADANVRLHAAIFAFDADPDRCRQMLENLVPEPDLVGLRAMAWLGYKDSPYAAEVERRAHLPDEPFKDEMARKLDSFLRNPE